MQMNDGNRVESAPHCRVSKARLTVALGQEPANPVVPHAEETWQRSRYALPDAADLFSFVAELSSGSGS
jgi:hypothetical protein